MIPRPVTSPRLARALVLLVLAALVATGCSRGNTRDEANEGVPASELYDKGHQSMRRGNWSNAANTYRRLVAQYPYGPYTEQALVESAYAQFKMGNNAEAISAIDRFIRTYPTHRHIPYMYYLRGLTNANRDTVFLQRVWSLDSSRRDLAAPNQAYADFNIVTDRYPNSRYAADARQRMVALRNTFARHEIETGLYYLRRGAYVAATQRATYLLETYPQSEYQNDAVALLAVAYDGLGNDALAGDARRVLQQNEPGHPALAGNWPNEPWRIRRLNPFATERTAIDNRD
ncbi:outer membrane protein assembly factor BamD [Luteimonas deserti]|uniref:Outer membrane protein assembly factor BamD n=1 Tax=Luteimonas deserti TaxID=2752306 RepID=A0A7Z0TXZ2_9GAMM|nr:outer membrane protein assembly factor BamD [Luteimonas deserti]NYZ62345.1 outer membrane protein assembly factor BamD [Luteimonas deserti]